MILSGRQAFPLLTLFNFFIFHDPKFKAFSSYFLLYNLFVHFLTYCKLSAKSEKH